MLAAPRNPRARRIAACDSSGDRFPEGLRNDCDPAPSTSRPGTPLHPARRPRAPPIPAFYGEWLSLVIPLPHIFQRLRQRLLFHRAISVPGVARENELIMISLGRQHSGHILI